MGEQLPSGILLFFALALFLAAVFVFFSRGEGASTLLGIALVVLGGAFVWLVGGGQEARPETVARIEPENTMETTSEETTSASRPTGQSQGETVGSYANSRIDQQFAAATQTKQATDYETGVINEAARRLDPRAVLAGRGFPC